MRALLLLAWCLGAGFACVLNGQMYAFCKDFSDFELFWSLSPPDSPQRVLTISAVFPQTTGWVSIGFHSKHAMVGGSAVVGWNSNQTEAHEYKLEGMSPSEVVLGNTLALTEAPTFSLVNGKSILAFKRQANSGAFPLVEGQEAFVLWAANTKTAPAAGSTTLSMHDKDGVKRVAFDTGATQVSTTIRWDYIHGTLMSITFVFLLPIGVLIARYFKFYKPPLWFQLHQYIQYAGVGTATVAFIIALKFLNSGFFKTHKIIGIITVVLALFQPLNSFFRPHPAAPGQEPSSARKTWNLIHWWGGRLCVVLGFINVYIGLDIVQANHLFTIGLSIYLFALLCAALWFSYQNFDRLLRKRSSASSRVEVTKNGEKGHDKERDHLLRSHLPSGQSDDES